MNNVSQNIRDTINKNNARIEELLTPGSFVLNNEINRLLKQNEELRAICKHEFVDGVCKWCDLPEE